MLSCSKCSRQFATERDFMTKTSRWLRDDKKNLWFRCSCGQSLSIPDGQYGWYAPSKMMSHEAASVFNQLALKSDLPHIPNSIMDLQQLLYDPDSDAAAIVKALRKDPLLAAETLANANAMKLSSGSKITSLEHAVAFIGRDTLNELVMLASLKMAVFKSRRFTSDDFWKSARITAALAERICRKHAPNISPEEAYLAGALCNIGKVVAAICMPTEIDRLYTTINEPKSLSTWRKAESSHGGVDHCILGEIACSIWGLPGFVLDASVHHHDSDLTDEKEPVDVTACVALANQLTHWVTLNPHLIDEKYMYTLAKRFGLGESDLAALCDAVRKDLEAS